MTYYLNTKQNSPIRILRLKLLVLVTNNILLLLYYIRFGYIFIEVRKIITRVSDIELVVIEKLLEKDS